MACVWFRLGPNLIFFQTLGSKFLKKMENIKVKSRLDPLNFLILGLETFQTCCTFQVWVRFEELQTWLTMINFIWAIIEFFIHHYHNPSFELLLFRLIQQPRSTECNEEKELTFTICCPFFLVVVLIGVVVEVAFHWCLMMR